MTQNNEIPQDIGKYAVGYEPGTPERENVQDLLRRIRSTKDEDRRDDLTTKLESTQIGRFSIQGWSIRDGSVCLRLLNGSDKPYFAKVYDLSQKELDNFPESD
jgi:hypothetical protein